MQTQFDLFSLLIGAGVGVLLGLFLALYFITPRLKQKMGRGLQERKDQMISLTSHYLLNPITIIQTAITQLQENEGTLTGEQRGKLYQAIARGQQRLWILTEQFFLVGEVDQGELELKIAVGDVLEMVSDAIAALDPFARAKNLKMRLRDHPNQLQEARFDTRRMKQAVMAVLDNAIKFSPEEGTVNVDLNLESSVFTITVQDQGIGIPDEIVAHLAEKFTRGSALYNFDYEGIGLGLHIAQSIVRMHEGNISFSSKPGQGTTVLIQFPNL